MEAVRSAASFEGLIILAVIYWILNALSKAGRKQGRSPVPPPPQGDPPPSGTQQEGFSLEGVLREIERMKQQAEQRSGQQKLPLPLPRSEPRQDRPRLSNPAPRAKPAGKSPRHLPDATQHGRHLPDAAQHSRHLPDVTEHSRHLPDAAQHSRRLPETPRRGRMAAAQTDRGPLGRHSRIGLPSSEEMEDRTSLEEGSLEVDGRLENLDEARIRPREVVDQDEGAEAIIQRRIKEAEARNDAFSEKDHRRFHEQIGKTEAAQAARKAFTPAQLRQAFIWREILGPPKALE